MIFIPLQGDVDIAHADTAYPLPVGGVEAVHVRLLQSGSQAKSQEKATKATPDTPKPKVKVPHTGSAVTVKRLPGKTTQVVKGAGGTPRNTVSTKAIGKTPATTPKKAANPRTTTTATKQSKTQTKSATKKAS